MDLNGIIFRFINGMAYKNAVVDRVMIVFSEYVPDIFMVALAAAFIIGMVKKNRELRGTSIDTFIVIILNLFIGYVIGAVWYVPRPFVNKKVNLLIPHVVDASFPSDHAIGTMSIGVGIGKYSKIYGVFLAILSILVGISRVFVGHHYPTDVLGGYIIVFIVSFIYDRLFKNKVRSSYFKFEELLAEKFPVLKQFL